MVEKTTPGELNKNHQRSCLLFNIHLLSNILKFPEAETYASVKSYIIYVFNTSQLSCFIIQYSFGKEIWIYINIHYSSFTAGYNELTKFWNLSCVPTASTCKVRIYTFWIEFHPLYLILKGENRKPQWVEVS